jgi:hypothetical protein
MGVMARARNLKPSFFHDAKLLKCEPWVRLLFAGLWCQADRRGILRDDPEQLAINIFPRDPFDVETGLQALTEGGFIVRYESQGIACIKVVNFTNHQNPHKDEKPSDLPDIPDETRCDTGLAPGQHGGNPADSLVLTTNPLSLDCGLLGRERDAPAALAPVTYPPKFLRFWAMWSEPPTKGHGSRKLAADEWRTLKLEKASDEVLAAIEAGLRGWQASEGWRKEGGKYVLHAHRWLKARGWEDEPPDDEPARASPASVNGRPAAADRLARKVADMEAAQ